MSSIFSSSRLLQLLGAWGSVLPSARTSSQRTPPPSLLSRGSLRVKAPSLWLLRHLHSICTFFPRARPCFAGGAPQVWLPCAPGALAPSSQDWAWLVLGAQTAGAQLMDKAKVRPPSRWHKPLPRHSKAPPPPPPAEVGELDLTPSGRSSSSSSGP